MAPSRPCATAIVILSLGVPVHAGAVRRPRTSTFALTHVRVVDGTGGPPQIDQTIVVENGRIRRMAPASSAHVPDGVERIDMSERTIVPGLVGMHDHLFYQMEPPSGSVAYPAQSAFAKLYLASGVTTIRTAGAVDFRGDVGLKQRIDDGAEPGPRIHLTSVYLGAPAGPPDPDGIAKVVDRFADAGATWFKAYTTLRSSELKAAIKAAHDRGLRVMGHLCAVGFREATALGIDNIEHGLPFDAELYAGKRPDECPNQWSVFEDVNRYDVTDAEIQRIIADLVSHGVAVTSTLPVLDSYTGAGAAYDNRVERMLAPRIRDAYENAAGAVSDPASPKSRWFRAMLRKEMAFERAFAAAGGRLVAGLDPTGWGGVMAGFGDQREVELLVEAGFRPEKAIQIATSNGARLLDVRDIGTIEPGMVADFVVIDGDPVKSIPDIRKVETVFKNGVAYDPAALIAGAEGTVGSVTWTSWAGLGIILRVLVIALIPVVLVRRVRKLWMRPRRSMSAASAS